MKISGPAGAGPYDDRTLRQDLEHDRSAVALFELLRAAHRDHRVQDVQRVEPLLKQIPAAGLLHHVGRGDLPALEPAADDVEAAAIDGVGVVAALRAARRHDEHRVAALGHVISPLVALGLAGVFEAAELRFDVRHAVVIDTRQGIVQWAQASCLARPGPPVLCTATAYGTMPSPSARTQPITAAPLSQPRP